jgi:hypothetical protein
VPAAIITGILFALAFAACDSQPSVEDRLRGQWKNGDGNLIGFSAEGAATVGQEGLDGTGDCRYEVHGDTVLVTFPVNEETDAYVVYSMGLDGDTLRIRGLERFEGGASMRLTVEEYAAQSGRPLYKLDFLKEKETKKVAP